MGEAAEQGMPLEASLEFAANSSSSPDVLWIFPLSFLLVFLLAPIHELGHVLAARMFGYDVLYVRLGNGTRLTGWKVGSIEIELCHSPWGGEAGVVWGPHSAPRFAIVYLSGVLAEVVAIGVIWMLAPLTVRLAALVALLLTVVNNWTPRTVRDGGRQVSSDGWHLANLWRYRHNAPEETNGDAALAQIRASMAQRSGDIERSMFLAKTALELAPEDPMSLGIYGTSLVMNEEWLEGYNYLAAAGEHDEVHPIFWCNAALAAVMTFEDELVPAADRFSELAYEAQPNDTLIAMARFVSLVVSGHQKEALHFLKWSAGGRLSRPNRAFRTAFVALAYHGLGEPEIVKAALADARTLYPKCPALPEIERRVASSLGNRVEPT